MGIDLVDGFNVTVAKPLDGRDVVADLTARDAIPLGIRYLGMPVHVIDSDGAGLAMNYQLVGGTGNINWVEFAGGGGGGISEWVAATVYKIGDQVIYLDTIYRANTAHTSDIAFSTNIANWDKILSSNISLLEVAVNYAVTPATDILLVTCSTSDITITLYNALACRKPITIKKMDATDYAVIISRVDTDLIDGETTYTLYNQYNATKLVGTGTTWSII